MAKYPTHEQIMAMPLRQQALALEMARHRARLADLHMADATMALLEDEQPALKALGVTLYGEQVSPMRGERHTLRVCTYDEPRLYKALIEIGFIEESRSTGSYLIVVLKKGKLRVRTFIGASQLAALDAEKAAAAAAAATPCVAGSAA